jgi:hypothetical protein
VPNLLGLICGHFYYYCTEVAPQMILPEAAIPALARIGRGVRSLSLYSSLGPRSTPDRAQIARAMSAGARALAASRPACVLPPPPPAPPPPPPPVSSQVCR